VQLLEMLSIETVDPVGVKKFAVMAVVIAAGSGRSVPSPLTIPAWTISAEFSGSKSFPARKYFQCTLHR
jgi:hypothetical protein